MPCRRSRLWPSAPATACCSRCACLAFRDCCRGNTSASKLSIGLRLVAPCAVHLVSSPVMVPARAGKEAIRSNAFLLQTTMEAVVTQLTMGHGPYLKCCIARRQTCLHQKTNPHAMRIQLTAGVLACQGGKEAARSNAILHRTIVEAVAQAAPSVGRDLISLVTTRQGVDDLLKLDDVIDLVPSTFLDPCRQTHCLTVVPNHTIHHLLMDLAYFTCLIFKSLILLVPTCKGVDNLLKLDDVIDVVPSFAFVF